jgi:hypothetical protein
MHVLAVLAQKRRRRQIHAGPLPRRTGLDGRPENGRARRRPARHRCSLGPPSHAGCPRRYIISTAARAADAAILVTGPYPEDLEQVGIVAAAVQALGKPTGIILNKTPPKSHALTLARAALTAFQLPICPTALTHW